MISLWIRSRYRYAIHWRSASGIYKHPARWAISPDRAEFGWPRAAYGPKFKNPLHSSFVPRPIGYKCQVTSKSPPAISEPYGFENVNSVRTNRRTDTYDRLSKSSRVIVVFTVVLVTDVLLQLDHVSGATYLPVCEKRKSAAQNLKEN